MVSILILSSALNVIEGIDLCFGASRASAKARVCATIFDSKYRRMQFSRWFPLLQLGLVSAAQKQQQPATEHSVQVSAAGNVESDEANAPSPSSKKTAVTRSKGAIANIQEGNSKRLLQFSSLVHHL